MGKTIKCGDAEVYVNGEVAEFLEQDRKRSQAQERSDRRYLSKSSFETVAATTQYGSGADSVFSFVSRKLTLEKLHNVIKTLSEDEQRLIRLYFYKEMSMEEIGKLFGISKMAISKRLKKLLSKMRSLMET